MKLPSRHLQEPSRSFLFFPLFSLIFHITLFFVLQNLSSGQNHAKIKENEIIAMVDLESLKLPQSTQEEKAPEALKETLPVLPIPESTPTAPGPEPMPIASEVLAPPADGSDLSSESLDLPGPEDGQSEGLEAVAPDEVEMLQEEETAPSETALEEAEPLAETELPEPEEVEAKPESDPVPAEEALALNEALPEAPPAVAETPSSSVADATEPEGASADNDLASEASPVEEQSAPTSGKAPPVDQAPAPPPEPAAPDAPSDSGEESSEEGLLASAQKPEQEAKAAPAPSKKPSKAKIKKVGLLGLLGGGAKQRSHGGGRLLLAKNRLGPNKRASAKEARLPGRSLKATQKVASLRKKVLLSEKNRLMRRKPSGRRSRSGIKIVQGSGRNYGVISAAIHQKKGRLTNVYNRLLQNNEHLQGNLIIEFVISPEGRVIKSQILTSSIGNPSFEKALIKEIRRWRFPSVKTGQTTVLYPLSFFPSS